MLKRTNFFLTFLDAQVGLLVGQSCWLAIFAAAASVIAMTIDAQAANSQSPQNNVQTIFPEQAAVIAGVDIPILEKAAMAGSPEAARKLQTYYAMIRFDYKQAEYWAQIRIENGDRDARYDLGTYLSDDDDLLSHVRARYWLKQIVTDGPPDLSNLAKETLEGMDERDRKAKPQ